MWGRVRHYRHQFLSALHLRLWLCNAVGSLLPDYVGGVIRARLYRLAGFRVAPSAYVMGNLDLVSALPGFNDKLTVGANTRISIRVTINLDGPVTIEDDVTLSPFVRIFTGTHEVGPTTVRCRAEVVAKPVVIERGCWIALGATILPGVRVGRGSVVAAGAVVTTDIPPNSFVAGVPARVVRTLPTEMADASWAPSQPITAGCR